ncbi:MAG: tyrosine-type recombinase/integrase [Proteobacteria bacterium]|nr:tyrosine-type recombinase/integrase [Pseudomonadota bacterium]
MRTLDEYLEAAARENTRRSYANAVRHFEDAGGLLPATGEAVARYLAQQGGVLSNNTLRQRVAALGRWHADHGFVDPTRDALVRQTLKGIRAVHGTKEKQAAPLLLQQIEQVVDSLCERAAAAQACGDAGAQRRLARDRALLLLGFWRAFRGDELVRLEAQHVKLAPGEGMELHLPRTKADRQNTGTTWKVPALSRLCPVEAMQAWLHVSGVSSGPVFRQVGRWGDIGRRGLHPNSIPKLLRSILAAGGLAETKQFSGHSLRRGLAGWAHANGWDVKNLMAYVGWRDLRSAMRYIDVDPFARERLEAGLASAAPIVVRPTFGPNAPPPRRALELRLLLSPFVGKAGLKGARRHIEEICLARHGGRPLGEDGTRYALWLDEGDIEGTGFEERIAELLDELHRIADNHSCYLEATLSDPQSRERWD